MTGISVESAYILGLELSLFVVLLLLGIVLRTTTFFLTYEASTALLSVQSGIVVIVEVLAVSESTVRCVPIIVSAVCEEGFGALVLLLLVRRNRGLDLVNKLA